MEGLDKSSNEYARLRNIADVNLTVYNELLHPAKKQGKISPSKKADDPWPGDAARVEIPQQAHFLL